MDEDSWKEDTLAWQCADPNSCDCRDVASPGVITSYPGLSVALNSHLLSSFMLFNASKEYTTNVFFRIYFKKKTSNFHSAKG